MTKLRIALRKTYFVFEKRFYSEEIKKLKVFLQIMLQPED